MNKKMIDKLEGCMRYVYSHFLEESDMIQDLLTSRKLMYARIRHAMRERLYTRMGCTLKQIGQAEGRITGQATDHSTIHHSVERIKQGRINVWAIGQVDKLVDEFEQYWRMLNDPPAVSRIQHYLAMDHHVLAAIVGLAENFGWAQKTKLDGLHKEFKTVSREFVEGL